MIMESIFPYLGYFAIIFFEMGLVSVDCSMDYVVVLKNLHLEHSVHKSEFLSAHINYLQVSHPDVKIKHIYKNLLEFDYIAYSASLDKRAYESIKSDSRVEHIDSVSVVRASTNSMVTYIPFEPDSLETLKLDKITAPNAGSKCTYEYSTYFEFLKVANNYTNGIYGENVVRNFK